MTENTDASSERDLLEESPEDSALIKELRKQLKTASRNASDLEAEVTGFREGRKQARLNAVEAAVNGRGYPQPVIDALKDKVQDADDAEFDAILAELAPVAEGEAPPTEEPAKAPVSPAALGQQIAAAAGGRGADDLKDKLLAAKTADEVKQVALQGGLGNIK